MFLRCQCPKWVLSIFLLLVLSGPVLLGHGRLAATLVDEKGEPLPGAYFMIDALAMRSVADVEGKVSFDHVESGEYLFSASHVGYQTVRQKIVVRDDETLRLKVVLAEASAQLQEVVITGESAVQEIRQAPYHVNVLDAKPLQAQPAPMIALVNQIAGVKVREEGGMGSQVNIMLDGIGGKGVRIFVDNIPADLLGSGMALNNLPVNTIERVEVYKGVVPVKFGSDALGGVINIVPRSVQKDYVDASVTYGSWNTLQSTLSAGKHFGKDKTFFVGTTVFYNHSDNDYWMNNVDVKADELGNTRTDKARRFNDRYSSLLGEVTLGVERKPWADVFKLNVSASSTDKQWQHGVTANRPWGETFSEQQNFNAAVTWRKSGLVREKLDLSLVAGLNRKQTLFIDTARKIYYWNDQYIINQQQQGESGLFTHGRTRDMDNTNVFGRINALYTLNTMNVLNFTGFFTKENLSGKDEMGTLTYGHDPLENPQELLKSYAGLSWESKWWKERLTNIASLKHFYSRSVTSFLDVDYKYKGDQTVRASESGYGDALKIMLGPVLSAVASYEYTLRQPDAVELFGDYIQVFPNPQLRPERSRNLNLGLRFNRQKHSSLSAEVNFFYRKTSNQIFLNTLTFSEAAYMNLLGTETKGIESEIRFQPVSNVNLYVNGTYQDIRLDQADAGGRIQPRYIGARIPNTPYLFANAGTTVTLPDTQAKTFKIQLYYYFNFVNQFFRSWEIDGSQNTKAIIPGQFIHTAGLAWFFASERASLSAECRNFTNAEAYDNYSVQKPGRSIYIKLRIYLTKQ